MNDLISRQAAIKIVRKAKDKSEAHRMLIQMPSAEPERKIYAEMSDEEFEKWLYEHGICHPDIHETISCKAVQLLIDDAINELPHTEPERHGRWINPMDGDLRFMCSVCHGREYVPTIMGEPTIWDYCPNCGARMDGEE